MATKTYRVKIVRDGQEFEAEGDKSFVLQMLKKFESPGEGFSVSAQKPKTTRGRPEGASTTLLVSVYLFMVPFAAPLALFPAIM